MTGRPAQRHSKWREGWWERRALGQAPVQSDRHRAIQVAIRGVMEACRECSGGSPLAPSARRHQADVRLPVPFARTRGGQEALNDVPARCPFAGRPAAAVTFAAAPAPLLSPLHATRSLTRHRPQGQGPQHPADAPVRRPFRKPRNLRRPRAGTSLGSATASPWLGIVVTGPRVVTVHVPHSRLPFVKVSLRDVCLRRLHPASAERRAIVRKHQDAVLRCLHSRDAWLPEQLQLLPGIVALPRCLRLQQVQDWVRLLGLQVELHAGRPHHRQRPRGPAARVSICISCRSSPALPPGH